MMANIQCALCEDYFNDPRLLPCLHTYCLSCLEKETKCEDNTLTCPGCKETIPIGESGLKHLPRDLRKVHEVQCAQTHEKLQNTDVSCQACGRKDSSGKVVAYCFVCDEYLCVVCKDLHEKRPVTKSHALCVVGDNLTKERDSKMLKFFQLKDKCSLHSEHLLESFCQKCEMLTCRICREYDHREHIEQCKLIPKVAHEQMDELQAHEAVSHGDRHVLDGAIAKCEATMHAVRERSREVHEEIEKSLEEVKRGLMMQNRQVCNAKIADLESQHQELEKLKGCVSEASGLMHDYQSYYTPIEQLSTHQVVTRRAMDLKAKVQRCHSKLAPNRGSEFITHISLAVTKARMISLASISSGGHHPPGRCDAGYLPLAAMEKPHTILIVATDKEGKQFDFGGDNVKVSFVHLESKQPAREGDVEVNDNGDGSYCATFTPRRLGKHELKITIASLHIQGSPFLYNIHRARPSPLRLTAPEKIPKQGSSHSLSHPTDVAVTEKGYLAIAECGNHTVSLYTKDGRKIYFFGFVNSKGSLDGQFHSPTAVAIAGNFMFVCDSGNHRIQKFDIKNNSYVSKFGSKGKEMGQFSNPSGIAVDREGKVFVADSGNNRIQVFSEDGIFSHSFLCTGKQPQRLTFDHPGHLHVTVNRSNSIFVFKPDGTVCTSYGTGTLNSPVGIAIDGEGYIAISEGGGHKGLKIYYGEDYAPVQSLANQFKRAGGITCDDEGKFLVADYGSNCITKY